MTRAFTFTFQLRNIILFKKPILGSGHSLFRWSHPAAETKWRQGKSGGIAPHGRHVIDIDTPHRYLILMVSSALKTTSQYYQIHINNNVIPSLLSCIY